MSLFGSSLYSSNLFASSLYGQSAAPPPPDPALALGYNSFLDDSPTGLTSALRNYPVGAVSFLELELGYGSELNNDPTGLSSTLDLNPVATMSTLEINLGYNSEINNVHRYRTKLMAIKYGEIGKVLYVNAAFDINGQTPTNLILKFSRGNYSFTRDQGDGVSAPGVPSPVLPPNPDSSFPGGSLTASTYVTYSTQAIDWGATGFTEADDDWQVCLTLEAVGLVLHGDDSRLVIAEGC